MSTRHTSSYRTEYEVFAGPSSGVNLVAARRIREPPELKTIVAIFCEEGEKYIREHFADGANRSKS
jgi:cysteine synthase A